MTRPDRDDVHPRENEPMDSEQTIAWWETLPAIITGIGTVLGAVAAVVRKAVRDWIPAWRSQRSQDLAGSYLGDQELFRIKLRVWRRQLKAMRGILINASNCGWKDPNKPVVVSIVTESEDDEAPTVYERFRQWEADAAYKSLLHDVVAAKGQPVLVTTQTMQHGRLRDHYLHQGTVASIVFLLGFTPEGTMVFCSFNFGHPMLARFGQRWGAEERPCAEWFDQAAPYAEAAGRVKLDPETIQGIRLEGRRLWFGR